MTPLATVDESLSVQHGCAEVQKPPESLATRIQALEHELQQLRQQQRDDLVIITVAVVDNHVFSAHSLWQHRLVSPALSSALDEAGVDNTRRLGKFLQKWERGPIAGWRLERVCRDERGKVWAVSAAN